MQQLFDQRRYLIPFRSTLLPQIFTDTLVIGGGVAGLRAALAASEHGEVILLCKDEPGTSNTAWAQGGIAVVMNDRGGDAADSNQSHVADTLEAGAGLCDLPAVAACIDGAAERIRELISWGMKLDETSTGTLKRGREGGHSAARIVHADGDATGRELMRVLWARAKATTPGSNLGSGPTSTTAAASGGAGGGSGGGAPGSGPGSNGGIRLFTHCFALDLITPPTTGGSSSAINADGHTAPVMGAITHHPRYGLQVIWAKATILASGGAGVVYRETTNPKTATGDGLAMAYRAGATLADMAFFQFHPTTLYLAGASRALITEAVRGEGAYLVDDDGHRFMLGLHPLAELAPRDVVTRAIVKQLALRGGTNVWLDARHIESFDSRFPGIAQLLAKFDLDASKDLIPVHPAAHYMVGGVRTDLCGRTDVPGLYAVGEVACTGLHGANRLASNSLLEGLVIGEAAGRAASELTQRTPIGPPANPSAPYCAAPSNWSLALRPAPVPINSDIRPSDLAELDLTDVSSSLRSAMWRNAGIERTGSRLADAADMIDFWARYTLDKIFDSPEGWQLQNLLLTSALMVRSAHWRAESRGCHTRTDTPETSNQFHVHDCWKRGRETVEVRRVEDAPPPPERFVAPSAAASAPAVTIGQVPAR